MTPAEVSPTKQNTLLGVLNAVTSTNVDIIDANTIGLLGGKYIVLALTVTNFLGKMGTAKVDFNFTLSEGIYLKDVMETYVINPQTDFQLKPRIWLANCNFTDISIVRTQRM